MILLAVTSTLFPLLYLTLELPKRIINDAIGATSSVVEFWGYSLQQTTFLVILCGAFLAAVLAHGLMKMRINTMKGVLSERMLRRFRYQLINRALRFPQPYFERVSQGEMVSMITAESEPMGGLMGDAISQPVLQAGQMITILSFLFLQSVWFGLAAVALIPLQAWLIPKLQRQINLLNKERIQEVRLLAAQIGENAAGASTLRSNGGWRYRRAMISDQLGRLFAIRFDIYQKKFFMKFINNFISQLTPFMFYLVGGLLVLQGSVSLGALVAALAAYKDLSSPWKELLTYYNQTQDMSLRWDVVVERFAPPGMPDEKLFEGEPEKRPRLNGDIVLTHVSVRDMDGNQVLDDLNLAFPSGQTIGIATPSEEDRRAVAELLTREVVPSSGRVEIGGENLSGVHQSIVAARIGYASSRPVMFQGTFGDNVMMPMRFKPVTAPVEDPAFAETQRAGNSADPFQADWLDPSLAGLNSPAELRDWWLHLIDGLGSGPALFQRGSEQSFDPKEHQELARKLVELRPLVQQAVLKAGLEQQALVFDRNTYNPALPVAENLLFATPRVPVTQELLAGQTVFLGQLRELGLDETLVNLTRDVIEMLRQIFGLDGTDHPLFRKLGLEAKTYETAVELIEQTRNDGVAGLNDEQLANLLAVPLVISAEQIGPAFTDELKNRILELRHSHSEKLLERLSDVFVPLRGDEFAPGLTVMENALFGKVSQIGGTRSDEVRKLIVDVLDENGARPLVVELIYDVPVALGGQNLPALFAEPLAFTRATIKKPDILILENALASYDMATQVAVYKNLRSMLPDTTVIYLNDQFENPAVFDMYVEIRQGRVVSDEGPGEVEEDSAASADLARKLRALEQTPLFSGLDRRQLRLLAFGARWYDAKPGEVVFLKDDQPTDGAYVVLEGEAGLYLPQLEGPDQLIAKVGSGALVGELGLIRKEPRALSMIAETGLSCLRIGEEEFLAVVENDAATAFKLMQVIAGYVSN
ncbi:ABC transporter transmembrane domain-containing protein [Ruegeria meonggei]|uniref:Putative multidrug resistance ABC transporter ATP-binding/permease protein YheH n=1 Tax=Ruegeria meonggei TaxID=1446476 RepID=A0A1X7A8A1_9RHOB|nr:ABC transporter transmembrane domain-containing protein [Ruegeria meonggei]SLN73063.1 putative multidrug resistance ABC transporter ATP-binding/permease protein YheH [Ruegeria meonggei]